jgi:hypothetical protein
MGIVRIHLVEQLDPFPHKLILIRGFIILELRHIEIGRQ